MSKIQRLYNASSSIFSAERGGLNPTFNQIRWLQDQLDAMEPADVGIDGSSDYENKSQDGLIFGQAIAQITYIHIHESDHFSFNLIRLKLMLVSGLADRGFLLPAGAKIPLHDHPRMVVLSKVLYGSARVKSYDWVTTPKSKPNMSGLAKVVAENQLLQAPCKASVLFPRSGGNIHSFTAVTPCAILDVLAPPYSEELGRPSTYFSDIPIASVPGFAILEKIEMPDDLNVAGAPYVGPELSVDIDFC
ncbi:Plant cysteine oxidase 1 [Ananas comosus]|uniref:cysteine dioxygenase n=1 Tax=Ananas comosus TaxID=4615 RepID=A0A199VCS1_ANACO|nr:Plant cysteine oxidase 1 [Ananas comosus]